MERLCFVAGLTEIDYSPLQVGIGYKSGHLECIQRHLQCYGYPFQLDLLERQYPMEGSSSNRVGLRGGIGQKQGHGSVGKGELVQSSSFGGETNPVGMRIEFMNVPFDG